MSRGNRIKRFTWFECRTGDYRERISSKSARFPGLVGPRIIGGESAAIEEYPFVVSITCDRSSRSIWHLENRCLSSQVSLQNNGTFFGHQVEHFCGGSIVGEKWIITSAQCALRQDWYIVFEQYLRVHAICVRISIAYFFFLVFLQRATSEVPREGGHVALLRGRWQLWCPKRRDSSRL